MLFPRLRIFLPSLLLFILTFALFAPSIHHLLVNFDDPIFITHNPIVANGFSWRSVPRAFTALHGDKLMYTPLLWLSFLTDNAIYQASPDSPWGYHLTNVLLHAINAVLLFFILHFSIRRPWLAFVAAAFWALHPLRVESVAWVTERKDTLSTLFALASTLAYLRAFPAPDRRRNGCLALSFALFVAGLLAKPMLVTLPFLFLLLDFWPLRRFSFGDAPRALPRLALRKWPFFLLTALFSILTRILQTDAVGDIPLLQRLWCLPSNYLFYLAKSFWPVALLPQTPGIPVTPAYTVAAGVLLLALAALAVVSLRRLPGVTVGLAAFAGLLFPVSGIVFIGLYPVADRYSYLPAVGLSLALAALWDFPRASRRSAFSMAFFRTALVLAPFALAAATARLLPVWHDSASLYQRIAAFLPDHYGVQTFRFHQAFYSKGDLAEAGDAADRMFAANPLRPYSSFVKILHLSQTASSAEALAFFEANPPDESHSTVGDSLHLSLAVLAADTGDPTMADRQLALAAAPHYDDDSSADLFHAVSAWILWRTDRPGEALDRARNIPSLASAQSLSPEVLLRPATAVWHLGLRRQALPTLLRIARDASSNPALLNNVAWVLATTPDSPADPADVLLFARQAMASSPDHPILRDTWAVALAFAGRFDDAVAVDSAVAEDLRASTASDAPSVLANVEERLALFRERRPYTEDSSALLFFSP